MAKVTTVCENIFSIYGTYFMNLSVRIAVFWIQNLEKYRSLIWIHVLSLNWKLQ